MPKLGGDEPKKISGANAPTSSPQTWFGGYAPLSLTHVRAPKGTKQNSLADTHWNSYVTDKLR